MVAAFTLFIHWQVQRLNVEIAKLGKKKLFFKLASERFLFIIFVQKLSHHWKERKNHTLENSKLQLL